MLLLISVIFDELNQYKYAKPATCMEFLSLNINLETNSVLKKLVSVRAALAGLNGIAESIPNERILISTLALQEAKDSSAIENIVTTHDELYASDNNAREFTTLAAKEVYNYAFALQQGFEEVKKLTCLPAIK